MELSKDELIFNIIEKQASYLDNINEFIININNNSSLWTELEFNNFISVMRSNNFEETNNQEYLEISTDENILIIKQMKYIIQYCSSNEINKIPHEWFLCKTLVQDDINELFDANIKMGIYRTITTTKPDIWDDIDKKYKIVKKLVYKDVKNNIEYIANIVKESNISSSSFKQSGILKMPQKYEFSIKINNKEYAINSIIKLLQSLNLSNILLTKQQQKQILEEYYLLVKNDIKIRYSKGNIPLLTPKPVTLERTNLIDPSEYGAISILKGYTVTEKADGERLLMYINNQGNVYIINNTLHIEKINITVNKKAYNTLIDGEYISCNKRKDKDTKNIFAAFDLYYINSNKITDLPLIDSKKCRYEELKSLLNLLDCSNSTVEFMVKEHVYSDNILKDCNNILKNKFPYDIDGLIFTPVNLPVLSYYPSKPVEITENMKWDRVFKWKPHEQNSIDFLVTEGKTIVKDGQKYKELNLYVGYNASQIDDINPDEGLKLRYDYQYLKNKQENIKYKPVLFKPTNYYYPDVDKAFIKINSYGDIRAENEDKIENNSIVEFSYDTSKKQWIPLRVREDKTRILRKGEYSKTLNDYMVAINIWRSIHLPVTTAMITGNEEVYSKDAPDDVEERTLDTGDIYYSRNIPRDSLFSIHMLNFHNQSIKKNLYLKPKHRRTLLELACGEGGDMNRWLECGYEFILGVDLVKSNIYNPRSGAYSRMLSRKRQHNFKKNIEKTFFPDMAFAVGDCAKNIKDGYASTIVNDHESAKVLKIVLNKQNNVDKNYKYIAGRGANGFDAISCQFAVHYFFESENKLDGFLNNVSNNLKKDGYFICTFMDGQTVENAIKNNNGDSIEGRKIFNDNNIPIWAIIRRYDDNSTNYNKKIDVYIENTQKLITEYLVNFELLIEKAKVFGLELNETEMFSESFNKIKEKISHDEASREHIDNDILEMDKDPIIKQFSFLNRWVVFKKIV